MRFDAVAARAVRVVLLFAALSPFGCATRENQPAPNPAPDMSQEAPRAERPEAVAYGFATYDEAMGFVRQHFSGERIDTSRSSWITGAEYFEADGRGYLILGMKGREYIFEGVPPAVWGEFKSAPSLGSYYSSEIRGRYGFDLGRARP